MSHQMLSNFAGCKRTIIRELTHTHTVYLPTHTSDVRFRLSAILCQRGNLKGNENVTFRGVRRRLYKLTKSLETF